MKEQPFHKRKISTPKNREKAIEMQKRGYSVRQIMRKLGYKSTNSVAKLLRPIKNNGCCPKCGEPYL